MVVRSPGGCRLRLERARRRGLRVLCGRAPELRLHLAGDLRPLCKPPRVLCALVGKRRQLRFRTRRGAIQPLVPGRGTENPLVDQPPRRLMPQPQEFSHHPSQMAKRATISATMTDSRDWFPSGEEPNPMRAAQAGMKPALPKRFYKEAGVEERDGVFSLVLDGRPAKTPGRQALAVPTRGLAEALAEEWAAQGQEVDPS